MKLSSFWFKYFFVLCKMKKLAKKRKKFEQLSFCSECKWRQTLGPVNTWRDLLNEALAIPFLCSNFRVRSPSLGRAKLTWLIMLENGSPTNQKSTGPRLFPNFQLAVLKSACKAFVGPPYIDWLIFHLNLSQTMRVSSKILHHELLDFKGHI